MRIGSFYSGVGLLLLAVVVAVLNVLIDRAVPNVRVDLTEENLYSLSPGTRNLVRNLEQPVTLYLFFSDSESSDLPFVRAYAKRVRELLEEYARISDAVTLEVIDPEPFSPAEDRANEMGLGTIRAGASGKEIYFGLAAENAEGQRELVPFFTPEREEFLEYDLGKLLYGLSRGRQPVIGLVSNIDVLGGFDFMARRQTPPWMAFTQLQQLFELRDLGVDIASIDPAEIDLLLLVHPQNLTDKSRYAIDQFVLRGGNLMLFLDPHAAAATQGMPGLGDAASNLPELLTHWGVEMPADQVLLDDRYALTVNMGPDRPAQRHPAILGFEGDAINGDDVVTARLEYLLFGTPGVLRPTGAGRMQFTPLVQSSAQAMTTSAEQFAMLENPEALYAEFEPTGERYTVAARLHGELQTAFPDGPPPPEPEDASGETEPAADEGDAAQETAEEATDQADAAPVLPHIAASQAPANILVVADTDVLTDRLWITVRELFGQRIGSPFADNGDFLANAVDNLSGNSDLIGIRARGRFYRPFEVVNALQRDAEQRLRSTQQTLQQQLQETETRMAELEAAKQGTEVSELSEDQEAELERFMEQRLEIRKQLRQVQHQLNEDIERLGAWIKAINYLAVPVLLVLGVAVWHVFRRRALRLQQRHSELHAQ